eukprot:Hpha_TRINITY_DN18771_c0_g1::TRINITY_DN18771_c0_g1_i1::g.47486::m.47486
MAKMASGKKTSAKTSGTQKASTKKSAPPAKKTATRSNKSGVEKPKKTTKDSQPQHRIFGMPFSKMYPLYVAKAARKSRSKAEVDEVIRWLTGYTSKQVQTHIDKGTDFKTFFTAAAKLNPKRKLITGKVCGVEVKDVSDATMREIRYLDRQAHR